MNDYNGWDDVDGVSALRAMVNDCDQGMCPMAAVKLVEMLRAVEAAEREEG